MDRLEALERKVMKDDEIDQSGFALAALRDFQIDMLNKLRRLRDTMDSDIKQNHGPSNEDMIRENEELKAKVNKLEYRISHLLRHIPDVGLKIQ